MVFNKLGGIYYTETYDVQKVDYGGSIPCFIGRTINPYKDYTAQATQKLKEEHDNDAEYTPTTTELNNKISELKQSEIAKHKINVLQKFTNFEQVNTTTLTDGKLDGLGNYEEEGEDNPLLKCIHDFCEETKMMTEEYVACPYFYVIDLGMADTLDQWIDSIETSKTKREIDYEVYVGFEDVKDTALDNQGRKTTLSTNAKLEDFILAVNYNLVMERQVIGDFRKAFYTKQTINATTHKYEKDSYYINNYRTVDNEMIALARNITGLNNTSDTATNIYDAYFHTDNNKYYDGTIAHNTTNTISKSRTYIVEPLHFGHTIGRISTTPYDMEPGYYAYNVLTVDNIILRKPNEQLQLQMNGVIFNHLEETSTEEYIKINRTQAVSSNLNNHPPDSLYQSRNLCDELLTRLFDICYPQLKNKETETNIGYLQTQVNKVINDSITDGDFIPPYTVNNENKGTFMSVQESTEDAYDLELVGMLQPSNCTYSIHIIAQINDAKIKVVET